MNDIFKCGIAFGIGAAIAYIVTSKILDKKYRKIADDEIKSMKEYYSKKYDGNESTDGNESADEDAEDKETTDEKPNPYHTDCPELINEFYKKYAPQNNEDESPKIRIIAPDTIGDAGFEIVSMVYYGADSTLVDSNGEIITDFDDLIGADSISRIGEYGDESVCVRNYTLQKDYEILYDPGYYSPENEYRDGD